MRKLQDFLLFDRNNSYATCPLTRLGGDDFKYFCHLFAGERGRFYDYVDVFGRGSDNGVLKPRGLYQPFENKFGIHGGGKGKLVAFCLSNRLRGRRLVCDNGVKIHYGLIARFGPVRAIGRKEVGRNKVFAGTRVCLFGTLVEIDVKHARDYEKRYHTYQNENFALFP